MSDGARSPQTDGEQGSDRVADRAPPSPIDDVRQLQRAIGNRALAREPAPPEVERAVRTPGWEIPARVRASFEAAFGRDFSESAGQPA